MRFRSLVPVAVLLGLIVGVAMYAAVGTEAKDAKGCAGLSDYRGAMFLVWDDKGTPIVQPNPLTMSSSDYETLANAAAMFQRILIAIKPPAFAAPWHQLQIEQMGVVEQAMTAIAKDGLIAVLGFTEPLDALDAKMETAVQVASQTCADFPAFARDYEALATPTV